MNIYPPPQLVLWFCPAYSITLSAYILYSLCRHTKLSETPRRRYVQLMLGHREWGHKALAVLFNTTSCIIVIPLSSFTTNIKSKLTDFYDNLLAITVIAIN